MSTIANLPTPNSYDGMFVNAFNFPPEDFNFYQSKPGLSNYNSGDNSRLRGAFWFKEQHDCVVNYAVSLNEGDNLTNLTFEFWVKADTEKSRSDQMLMGYKESSTGQEYLSISDPANLTLNIDERYIYQTHCSLMDGKWHHIAVVFDASVGVKFYFDTLEIPLDHHTVYIPFTDNGYFVIGNREENTLTYFNYGMIGQVRIWNEARSLADIIACAGRYLSGEAFPALRLYWSDAYDSEGTITDSSAGHNNNGTISEQSSPDQLIGMWNDTEYFGGFNQNDLITRAYTNMTGNAELQNGTFQYIDVALKNDISEVDRISVECWIRFDGGTTASQHIFKLQDAATMGLIFQIKNPQSIKIELESAAGDNVDFTSDASLSDGLWHHLALTWVSGSLPQLYLDGVQKTVTTTATSYTWKNTGTSHWIILLGGNNSLSKTLNGGISEFRFWKSIRSQEEIVVDASYRLQETPEDLLVYWPFARSFSGNNRVEDLSAYYNNGFIGGGPTWNNTQVFGLLSQGFPVAPPIPATAVAGTPATGWNYGQLDVTSLVSGGTMVNGAAPGFPRISVDLLRQAFTDAHDSGYFDPMVFPNVYFTNATDSDDAQVALFVLTFDAFLSYWISGRRISFYRRLDETMTYDFIPIPQNVGPTLLLLLDTRIMSYFGDVGEGQVVRTFSLMPGEKTYASINTYKKNTQQESDTSSIFDSDNASAKQSFENSLQMEAGIKGSLSAALDFHLSGETKVRWGEGNTDVKTTIKGEIEGNIQGHLQAVSNALRNHASERSSQRNVDINTAYTVTSETGTNTSITREFMNINNSKTLDVIFTQMNQQIVVQHMLTNIRVGYFDPAPGTYRAVQLSQLDDLLDQVLVSNADTKMSYKNTIVDAAYLAASMGIANYNLNNFIQQRDKISGAVSEIPIQTAPNSTQGYPEVSADKDYFINPAATSTFSIAGNTTSAQGVVLSTDYFTLRTDNVVADLKLGLNSGLDQYAQRLQEEAVRREQLENARIAAENNRLSVALDIIDQAISEGKSPQELAALYRSLMINPGTTKKIMHINDSTETRSNT